MPEALNWESIVHKVLSEGVTEGVATALLAGLKKEWAARPTHDCYFGIDAEDGCVDCGISYDEWVKLDRD